MAGDSMLCMIHICSDCAHIGIPRRQRRGSGRLELRLWLYFLLPGLLYSLWRLSTLHWACPRCRSGRLVRLDTPAGKGLATQPRPAVPAATSEHLPSNVSGV